jgi:hypothetical protein
MPPPNSERPISVPTEGKKKLHYFRKKGGNSQNIWNLEAGNGATSFLAARLSTTGDEMHNCTVALTLYHFASPFLKLSRSLALPGQKLKQPAATFSIRVWNTQTEPFISTIYFCDFNSDCRERTASVSSGQGQTRRLQLPVPPAYHHTPSPHGKLPQLWAPATRRFSMGSHRKPGLGSLLKWPNECIFV